MGLDADYRTGVVVAVTIKSETEVDIEAEPIENITPAAETHTSGRLLAKRLATLGVLRLVSVPVGFVSGLLVARIILSKAGVDGYATAMTLATISALIPFADLGLGAVVTNAASDARMSGNSSRLLVVLKMAFRYLFVFGLSVVLIASAISLLDGWGALLGGSVGSTDGLNLTMVLIALMFLVQTSTALGNRILLGFDKTVYASIFAAAIPTLNLLFVYILSLFDVPAAGYALALCWALAFVNAINLFIALRVARIGVRELKSVRGDSSLRGEILQLGVASLIVNSALAIAFSADRVVLSHRSEPVELAKYSILLPVYITLMSFLSTAGQQLWPTYRAGVRAGTVDWKKLKRHVGIATLVGCFLAIAALALAPAYVSIVSDGKVTVSFLSIAAVAALLVAQAAHVPSAMLLTDRRGMRRQAYVVGAMAAINLTLSIILAKRYGASGPLWASAIAVGVFQFPVTLALARARLNSTEYTG